MILPSFKKLVLLVLFIPLSHFCSAQPYVFFLHNKFLEDNLLNDAHPEYGQVEYFQIVHALRKEGFKVLSEIRPRQTRADTYARKVAGQIDSLIKKGVEPEQITVIGTSKGGYIAQLTSAHLKNKKVNYVFIGAYNEDDERKQPDVSFCGNVLSIFEKSDLRSQSSWDMMKRSANVVSGFKEIQLNTGLKDGFQFKALPEWIWPTVQWAKRSDAMEPGKNRHPGSRQDAALEIDKFLSATNSKQFNGVVLIDRAGISQLTKVYGDPYINKGEHFKFDDQFVIGSISKQFTAVLLLMEYEKGRVKLNVPISTYLPEIKAPWGGSVTVHHLLTHMHGIVSLDEPLAFQPGTAYAYSQIGYDLLAKITERTSGKSFAEQSVELFRKCRMHNTYHPDVKKYRNLVPGFTEQENGEPALETRTFQNFAAAGSFISTANDLVLWNTSLHGGRLLSDKTYRLMMAKKEGAERNHPIFGKVAYGYGVTVDTADDIVQFGQTGFAPGFISMNFYFPETKTSVIALTNMVWDESDLGKAFYYHSGLLSRVRKTSLVKKSK